MSYTVTILPSGHTFEVEPGKRVLDAGLSAGLSLPYSCRMGTCSTCKAHIAEGEFDFGDAHSHYLPLSERDRRMALLCQAKACSNLVIEVKELPKLQAPARFAAMLKRVTPLADDVVQLDIRLPLHQSLIFAAGQYVDLLLPDGQRRSYSLANASAAPMGTIDLTLHIAHMPGGLFTDQLFSKTIKERHRFDVEGPLGTFFLREDSAKPILMVATGTGYAPIRSMLLEIFRKKIDRPITFYWGGRRRKDLYLLRELEGWEQEWPNFKFVPVLSGATEEDQWIGRTGRVNRAVMEDMPDLSNHQVYACGVPAMVAAARHDFVEQCGLPRDEYYADAFVSSADLEVEPNRGETPPSTMDMPKKETTE